MLHKCKQIPEDYLAVSQQSRRYMLNNSSGGITGTHIEGFIPIFYCPLCGEKLV
jgi:hypothetical protein